MKITKPAIDAVADVIGSLPLSEDRRTLAQAVWMAVFVKQPKIVRLQMLNELLHEAVQFEADQPINKEPK